MGYLKTTWNSGAAPGISAEKLNKIEQGIYDAHYHGLVVDNPPTTNMNDLRDTGIYYGSSFTNSPPMASNTFFKVVVAFTDPNNGIQEITDRYGRKYNRAYRYGEWYPWNKIYNSKTLSYGTTVPPDTEGEDGDIFIKI